MTELFHNYFDALKYFIKKKNPKQEFSQNNFAQYSDIMLS